MKENDIVYLTTDVSYNGIELKAGLEFIIKEFPSNRTVKVYNSSVGDILLELDDITPYKRKVKYSQSWWYYLIFIIIGVLILIVFILNIVNFVHSFI